MSHSFISPVSSKAVLLACVLALGGCSSIQNQNAGAQDNSDLYQGSRALAYKSKTQNSSIEELNSEAKSALQSGNTDQAIFYLVQSLAKDPEQPEIYRRIGQIHLHMDNLNLAQAAFERALNKNPDDVESLTGLGKIHLKQKQRSLAQSYFMQAVDVDQKRFKPLLQPKPVAEEKGQATMKTESMAETSAKPILRVDRQSPYTVYNNLGVLADLESRFEEAQRYYRLAIKIQPANPSAYNNLGYSHYLAGNWPEAELYFHRAIEQDANFSQTWYNIGLLYVRMEKYEMAIDTFSRLMKEPEAYNTVGYLCMTSGKYLVAERYLEKAISSSPVYFAKARENLKQNRQYLEDSLVAKSTP